MTQLAFLKLGGSLITNKAVPHTPRLGPISRLCIEIAAALAEDPKIRLVVGHGSGSFGHIPARVFKTREGVYNQNQWRGFVEVWQEAAGLNHIIMQGFHHAGLLAMAFPASASMVASGRKVLSWEIAPLIQALNAGLLPVIYGDVIFDREQGGTIFSTEDLFYYLAQQLKPQRMLLAGLEAGVWKDFPLRKNLIKMITPKNAVEVYPSLGESVFVDVTGGMAGKVGAMLKLVEEVPDLEVVIFSGETPGLVKDVLLGNQAGTRIRNSIVV